MAGSAVLMELLKSAFLTVLFIVLVSSDVTEDFLVSYDVESNPSVQKFVIEYEPLVQGRYRRQAGTAANVTTTRQPTTSLSSTASQTTTPIPVTASPAVSSTRPSTTSTAAPTTITTKASTTKAPTTGAPAQPETTASGDIEGSTPSSQILEDTHQYYRSQIIPDAARVHWEDLSKAKRHNTLSKSHRTAVTINLSFKFRFYGHNVTNVTVATGGFLYASPFLHQWLTATQYIAPLMANFDLRIGEASDIFYDDFGDRFAVQWRNVVLRDQNSSGLFDFQAQLYADGTIKFLYNQLPISISKISSQNHPVKIGLSDAFYIDSYLKEQGIRRRTIFEYHRVSFHADQVAQGTVIILKPLPTCNIMSDCKQCVNHEDVNFDCKWCGAVGRCSDGIDWHRSEWINRGCTNLAFDNETLCDITTSSSTPTTSTSTSTPTTTKTTTTSPRSSPTTTTQSTTTKCPPGAHNNEKLCGVTTTSTTSTTTTTTPTAQTTAPQSGAKCPWVRDASGNDIDCITASSNNTVVDNTTLTTTNPALNNTASNTPADSAMTTAASSIVRATTATSNLTDTDTTAVTTSYTASTKIQFKSMESTTSGMRIYTHISSSGVPSDQTKHAISHSTTAQTQEILSKPTTVHTPNIDVPYGVVSNRKSGSSDFVEGEICENSTDGVCRSSPGGFPIGAVVAIILILLVVFGGIGVWVFYAYTHPTSQSGMWLMEHRPSQMKSKIANIKFWKSSTPTGTKYQVESEA